LSKIDAKTAPHFIYRRRCKIAFDLPPICNLHSAIFNSKKRPRPSQAGAPIPHDSRRDQIASRPFSLLD
jgi:hypothetical protein